MSRKKGHYWVKLDEKSNWETAVFTHQWELKGGTLPHNHNFYEIDPTRILTPDEKANKEALDAESKTRWVE